MHAFVHACTHAHMHPHAHMSLGVTCALLIVFLLESVYRLFTLKITIIELSKDILYDTHILRSYVVRIVRNNRCGASMSNKVGAHYGTMVRTARCSPMVLRRHQLCTMCCHRRWVHALPTRQELANYCKEITTHLASGL